MIKISKDLELKSAIQLFNAMVKDNLGYIYRGSFNDDITDSILEVTETSLKTDEHSSKIKKRVYAIMVEGLQNITRHQDAFKEAKPEYKSIFVIQRFDDRYFITTGNVIDSKHIQNIKKLIKKINSLSKEELKAYYKKVLEEGSISEKGGAGLGLIEMAKKSGNRLSFHFKTLSPDLSYFYLHTIPSLESSADIKINGNSHSLDRIINVHSILNLEDVLMIFNGIFSQESYANLLVLLQKNLSETADLKNKLSDIISELLQNIVKHGRQFKKGLSGNPGLFYVSKSDEHYLITTSNYIANSSIGNVHQYLDEINNKTQDEIAILSKKNKEQNTHKRKLGLIEIRRISNHPIHYFIEKSNDDFSFLSLRIKLHPSH